MCGIVGYVGEKEAAPILVNALKKLEYRGYDSAGIAVFDGQDIVVRKVKGALRLLVEDVTKQLVRQSDKDSDSECDKREAELIAQMGQFVKGSVGIGHTRWATHGEPSDVNAHPHTNVSGSIAIVHNGIVENYAKLKAWLQNQGVVFRSQTDTEVIAHLINYFYEQTGEIFPAVLETLHRLEGSYALGVVCSDFPDRIIAARKDSPLIVGLGKGENFIASDIPAVLEHTREVYFLDQKQVAVLYSDHVDLFDEDGNRVIKEPSHVEWDVSAAEKGGYSHFMLKEIYEQPKALTDTMRPRLVMEGGKPVDIKFDEVTKGQDFWKSAKRIVITACGTAYHAGVVARYAFEAFARMPVVVDVASEFRYRNPILNEDDVFIVISQSGETADTLEAMRQAKKAGIHVIAVTNCVGSTVSREADDVIYTWAGPEIAVASTKAYTTQLMCLYMLALKSASVRGTISSDEYKALLCDLEQIPQKVEQILKDQSRVQKFVANNFNKEKVFFIGRLFDSATSLECALKLKEVSYMHSEAFAAGELKHGPIALVDESTLVVALATWHGLYEKIASNIEEVRSRGCSTLVITQDEGKAFEGSANEIIQIPVCRDEFASILSVVPAQLFAYYCAVHRGINPDKPRNLAKSVTVE
ncbi:MAG: glutamine--fructose-6-phosphate transaminase (isomerizing) [Treponema sp.]|jgi:glucosamine--fructose-6-phosphate aminotransferase (isomerizing)|nr:glutamine--fructose-6-phosphate transaminase (isomerizing) [Treponema sp.]MBQ2207393.1 glutamine--fructose-6-phosphate transaminase (isomerizing) [Treponema sp.]MBQ3650185.1 glutamine--fructose-6-phosphate transaminase (isomerizing) [Treponema sp.]MBR0126197.1 glutamine--fructose-6-phosphate transaminase (isomerizing) [Treponema sp.]MBR0476005.1 glutamine--fructose-6-phosphate transaminase (isomerizing) [Treponema sp.]